MIMKRPLAISASLMTMAALTVSLISIPSAAYSACGVDDCSADLGPWSRQCCVQGAFRCIVYKRRVCSVYPTDGFKYDLIHQPLGLCPGNPGDVFPYNPPLQPAITCSSTDP